MKAANKAVDICRLAISSLGVHAVRSLLTSVGIIFGVFGFVAMLAITEGASYQSQLYLRELGSDKIIIQAIRPPAENKATGSEQGINEYGLTFKDLERLTNVPGVLRRVTLHQSKKNARHGIVRQTVTVIGAGPDLLKISRVDLVSGRFLAAADMTFAPRPRSACVITQGLARKLIKGRDPIGEVVTIEDQIYREPFTVVGILKYLPQVIKVPLGSRDNCIIIADPVRKRRLGKYNIFSEKGSRTYEKVEISQIVLQMVKEDAVKPGAKVAESILGRFHERPDFSVSVPLAELELKEKESLLWTIVMLVIAGISLVVGGIGIMNIMLASVTERTREIGIRRALGAKRADIAVQFLVESVTLTTIGGLVGIAAGWLGPMALDEMKVLPFETRITSWALIVPFVMAVGVGLVSGLYPAVRAAKLDPIEALRHE